MWSGMECIRFCMSTSVSTALNQTTKNQNWLIKPQRVCHVTANHQFTFGHRTDTPSVWQLALIQIQQVHVKMIDNYYIVRVSWNKDSSLAVKMFHIHWSFIVFNFHLFSLLTLSSFLLRLTADAALKNFDVCFFSSLFCRIFKWHIWMDEQLISPHKYGVRLDRHWMRISFFLNILFFFSLTLPSSFSKSRRIITYLFQPFNRFKRDLCMCVA